MTDYYSNLKARRNDERKRLEATTDSEARKRISQRIDKLSALIADYQSNYGVTMQCGCLK